MQEKIIAFKFDEDGSETRMPGLFNTDKEAIASFTEPGNYIFYKVVSVTTADLTKASENE